MEHGILLTVVVFLAAATIAVPVSSRLHLGAVLGYLVAGAIIAPFSDALEGDTSTSSIMKVAEFGIIMMLFLIGLELEIGALWRLRKRILGLGGLQVAATAFILAAIGCAFGIGPTKSIAGGLALALSSTALAAQVLEERGLLHTSTGESALAVLLFQDMAVIPILIVLPLIAGGSGAAIDHSVFADFPGWLHALIVAAIIGIIVVAGRRLSSYPFRFVAKSDQREVFTALSLLLIVGITLLMDLIGVSPALGAFIAGLVLAGSEYKQTLEADIEPFKGLLLGLFFITVGMGIDFDLLRSSPMTILGAVCCLVIVKLVVLFVLARGFGLVGSASALFAVLLCQGGEFGFVLFQFMQTLGILATRDVSILNLVVALSMVTTPILMLVNEKWVRPRLFSRLPERDYDNIVSQNAPVIIAGYGRFGQVVGRFLNAQDIRTTVLERDADQVDLLRRFGSDGYFGDASRLNLLRSAGAATAKLLIVAVDDVEKATKIVALAKQHFPNLQVLARARNRRHAYDLDQAGADYIRREMFDSSLTMARRAMELLGESRLAMRRRARQFERHDEKTLRESFALMDKEPELIRFAQRASRELEKILRQDLKER